MRNSFASMPAPEREARADARAHRPERLDQEARAVLERAAVARRCAGSRPARETPRARSRGPRGARRRRGPRAARAPRRRRSAPPGTRCRPRPSRGRRPSRRAPRYAEAAFATSSRVSSANRSPAFGSGTDGTHIGRPAFTSSCATLLACWSCAAALAPCRWQRRAKLLPVGQEAVVRERRLVRVAGALGPGDGRDARDHERDAAARARLVVVEDALAEPAVRRAPGSCPSASSGCGSSARAGRCGRARAGARSGEARSSRAAEQRVAGSTRLAQPSGLVAPAAPRPGSAARRAPAPRPRRARRRADPAARGTRRPRRAPRAGARPGPRSAARGSASRSSLAAPPPCRARTCPVQKRPKYSAEGRDSIIWPCGRRPAPRGAAPRWSGPCPAASWKVSTIASR